MEQTCEVDGKVFFLHESVAAYTCRDCVGRDDFSLCGNLGDCEDEHGKDYIWKEE